MFNQVKRTFTMKIPSVFLIVAIFGFALSVVVSRFVLVEIEEIDSKEPAISEQEGKVIDVIKKGSVKVLIIN